MRLKGGIGVRFEVPETEALVAIGPEGAGAPAGLLGEKSEVVDAVFVAVFGDDVVALLEGEGLVGDGDDLIAAADKTHFDATFSFVVEGAMFEAIDIDLGAAFAVDAGEEVEVEGGGDALGIVVGGFEDIGGFVEINADEERGVFAAPDAEVTQEIGGLWASEVPDGGTGEVEASFATFGEVGEAPVGGVIGADRGDAEIGVFGGDGLGASVEFGAGDVDGDVDLGSEEFVEKKASLETATGAEFHKAGGGANFGGDIGPVAGHEADFGAGGVVFFEVADLVKEQRTTIVIEVFTGDGGRIEAQASEYVEGKGAGIGLGKGNFEAHR